MVATGESPSCHGWLWSALNRCLPDKCGQAESVSCRAHTNLVPMSMLPHAVEETWERIPWASSLAPEEFVKMQKAVVSLRYNSSRLRRRAEMTGLARMVASGYVALTNIASP